MRRQLAPVVLFGVVILSVAGCSSYPSSRYKGTASSPYSYGKSGVSLPAPVMVATNNAKVVSLPASVPASTSTPPAAVSSVNIAMPPAVKPGPSNAVTLPATTVVITNIVSITNKVDAPSADVEIVNGQSRRVHFRFKDKAAEEGFLRLVARKQAALEDVRVIAKLYQEKNNQQQKFTSSLQEQFAVRADKNYQYDADTLTISEVVRPASEKEVAKTQMHMKLKDAAAAQSFVRMAASKRLSLEQMASLQLMFREKQMEVAEYDRQLSDAYAIVKDRTYQYDPATKTLYEMVKLPAGVEAPKSGGTVSGK